jgi:hypothetical protein
MCNSTVAYSNGLSLWMEERRRVGRVGYRTLPEVVQESADGPLPAEVAPPRFYARIRWKASAQGHTSVEPS